MSEIKNVGQTWTALNNFECNHLMPLHFKGLRDLDISFSLGCKRSVHHWHWSCCCRPWLQDLCLDCMQCFLFCVRG